MPAQVQLGSLGDTDGLSDRQVVRVLRGETDLVAPEVRGAFYPIAAAAGWALIGQLIPREEDRQREVSPGRAVEDEVWDELRARNSFDAYEERLARTHHMPLALSLPVYSGFDAESELAELDRWWTEAYTPEGQMAVERKGRKLRAARQRQGRRMARDLGVAFTENEEALWWLAGRAGHLAMLWNADVHDLLASSRGAWTEIAVVDPLVILYTSELFGGADGPVQLRGTVTARLQPKELRLWRPIGDWAAALGCAPVQGTPIPRSRVRLRKIGVLGEGDVGLP